MCHWTMRYEAKHNYLKKMGQNIGNYINICWTLAMRHQCYYSISGDSLFDEQTEIGPGIAIHKIIILMMPNYAYAGDTVAVRDCPVQLGNTSNCFRYIHLKF